MRLDPSTATWLLERVGRRLIGGTLTLDGDAGVLVAIPLEDFHVVDAGRIRFTELTPQPIQDAGYVTDGALYASDRTRLATLVVRAVTDPDVETADVVLDTRDLKRGGLCAITAVDLTLPLVSC